MFFIYRLFCIERPTMFTLRQDYVDGLTGYIICSVASDWLMMIQHIFFRPLIRSRVSQVSCRGPSALRWCNKCSEYKVVSGWLLHSCQLIPTMRTRMAGLSISLAFLFCLEVFILPGFVSGAKRDTGKYKHDTRGDTALPYKHDPAGDEALPYKHDKSGDTALPYKHDPAGKNWNSISF